MSDDLVNRLRNDFAGGYGNKRNLKEAADRIEALEAKLAKAVKALEFYASQDVTFPNVGTVTFHGSDDNGRMARATLATLRGDTYD